MLAAAERLTSEDTEGVVAVSKLAVVEDDCSILSKVRNTRRIHTTESELVLAAAESPRSDDTEAVVAVSTLAVVEDACSYFVRKVS